MRKKMIKKIIGVIFIILIIYIYCVCINNNAFANMEEDISIAIVPEPSIATEVKKDDIITYRMIVKNNSQKAYGYPLLLIELPKGTKYINVDSNDIFMDKVFTYGDFIGVIGTGLNAESENVFELNLKVLGTTEEVKYPKLEYSIVDSIFTVYNLYKTIDIPSYIAAKTMEEKQIILGNSIYINQFHLEGGYKVNKDSGNLEEEQNTSIESNKYIIRNNLIRVLESKCSVYEFLSNIINKTSEEIKMYKNGQIASEIQNISTGMILSLGEKIKYDIIVSGDISKEGKVSVLDLSILKGHIINTKQLVDVEYYAADVNDDKKITMVDLSRLKMLLVGLSI